MKKICKQLPITIFFLVAFAAHNSFATQFYVVATGKWTPGTPNSVLFNTTACGSPAAPNQNPGAGDDIWVCKNITLTIDSNIVNVVIRNLYVDTNGTVSIRPNTTLHVKGTLINIGTINGGGKLVQYYLSPGATVQWKAPSNATSADIEVWAAGGGGASAGVVTGKPGAGGGAGGAYAKTKVSIKPDSTYTFTVGKGGAGGGASPTGSDGNAGGDTWFSNTSINGISLQPANSTQGVWAKGGAGGKMPVANTGGTGGAPVLHTLDNLIGGNYGTAIHIGGYGGDGSLNGDGSGGGGGGGTGADANFISSGVVQVSGATAVQGGGPGGNGGPVYSPGFSPASGSGGGGGGGSTYEVIAITSPPYTTTTFFAGGDGSGGGGSIGIGTSGASAPPSYFGASKNIICIGENTNLIAVGGGGGMFETFRWYTGTCGGTLAGTGNMITVSPTITTTYYGRYENGPPLNYNSVCSSITIGVKTPPKITSCPGNQYDHSGSCVASFNYTVLASGDPLPAYTFQFTGATSGSGNGTGGSYSFYAGITSVTVTASNGCGSVQCNFNVYVDGTIGTMTCPPPTKTVNSNSPCAYITQGKEFDPVYSPGCYSQLYNNYNNNSTLSGATFPVGTTTVTWTLQNGPQFQYCTITITVLGPQPPVPITITGATTICPGGTTTLNASAPGGVSYTWSPVTGLSNPYSNMTDASPTQSRTYVVTVTNAAGCKSSKSITVFVSSFTVNVSAPTTICSGSSTTISAGGGTVYAWAPSTGLSNAAIAKPIASPAQTTTYTVTVTNASGCSATRTTTVTVNPLPVLTFISSSVCHNAPPFVLANGSPAGGSYSGPGVSGNMFDPASAGIGTHAIYYSYTDSKGCSNSIAGTVKVAIGGIVNITAPSTSGCGGSYIDSVLLTASPSISPVDTYQWYLNGVAISGGTDSSYNAVQSGWYNVIVTISGCPSDSTASGIPIVINNASCAQGATKKTVICHVPHCRHDKEITICIGNPSVDDHLRNHPCDCLGPCPTPHPNHREAEIDMSGIEFNVHPNPFTKEATVEFFISDPAHTTLQIFDLRGMLISKGFDGVAAGDEHYSVQVKGMAAGVYIAKLESGDFTRHLKLIVTD